MRAIVGFYLLYSLSCKAMKNRKRGIVIAVWGAMILAGISARAQQSSTTVKITPLGARTGEFCALDRALIFEDPTGVRILYDPGVTVAGGEDTRLGDVHAILVSHNHFDHIGSRKLMQDPEDPEAICGATPALAPAGNTVTTEIAVAKNSAVLVNLNMSVFLSKKIENIRGVPTPACSAGIEGRGPSETVVPRFSPCTGTLGFGTVMTVTRAAGAPGVRINMVAALHTDSIFNPRLHLAEPLGGYLADNGLSAYDGLASGFVLTFTNGLKVYLTGDTGPISDMAMIVRELYHANLAVPNVDGVSTMGPEEAAFAIKQLVKPAAVIPSHAGQAVTTDGQINPDTRIAQFIELLGGIPVYVPLSGRTMEFDGDANCVAGCDRGVRERSRGNK